MTTKYDNKVWLVWKQRQVQPITGRSSCDKLMHNTNCTLSPHLDVPLSICAIVDEKKALFEYALELTFWVCFGTDLLSMVWADNRLQEHPRWNRAWQGTGGSQQHTQSKAYIHMKGWTRGMKVYLVSVIREKEFQSCYYRYEMQLHHFIISIYDTY